MILSGLTINREVFIFCNSWMTLSSPIYISVPPINFRSKRKLLGMRG